MKDPKDPIDTDVQEAFGALAERIPDGYFDDFSTRVLARLPEGKDMDARREIARGSGLVRPDEAALTAAAGGRPPGKADPPRPGRGAEIVSDDEPDTAPVPKQSGDNTGLHDIQSLASSAKRRISQRISAEAEAQDSMLLSASSGAMKAVALPDPAKESSPEVERERIAALRQSGQMKVTRTKSTTNEPPVAAAAPTTLSAAAAPAPVARESSGAGASFGASIVEKEKSSAPWWILGGVATLAAAAAVAVFVFGVGRDKKDEGDTTAAAAGDQQVVASAEPAPAATPAPAPVATAIPPAEAEAGAAAGSAPEGGAAAGGAVVQPLDQEAADEAKVEEPADEKADKGDAKEAEKADTKGSKDKAPAPKSTEKPLKLKGTDLNDVLNQVTGGVDAPKAEEEKKAAVPTKKSLDRRDVDNAMEPVKGAALKCSALEQFEGSVMVKFTVAPSGQVTSASATNKKGPTGDCVAKAVKKAKFPPFDGAATSFTYPFLLAE